VAFESSVLAFIREHYSRDFSSASLKERQIFIRDAVQAALGLGFESEQDITGFVVLRWTYGNDFPSAEKFPWASRVLGEKNLSVSEKMASLMEAAREIDPKG